MTDLGTWDATSTSVDDVLDALADLRRTSQLGSIRAMVMTLVIVGHQKEELDRAVAGVHELGSKHPARTLVLQLAPTDRDALDASIGLEGNSNGDGGRVVFEDVHLHVRGAATRHLDSFIEPFTLPDLPVVVWFVDALPSPSDRVLTSADVVVVDSRDFGGLDCFANVALITGMTPVIDLSWVRLQPWRAALRGLFDTPALRPFATSVSSATVAGKTGPRHLMAGWLADRLDLALADIHLVETEHVSLDVRSIRDGRHASARVRRDAGQRTLRCDGRIEGGPEFSTTVPLPPSGPAWGLAEGLSRLVRDAVFESALSAAIEF